MNRKVTVVGGAGNVGATVARAIADKELADVVIIDIADQKAKGVALDMYEACPIEGSDARIIGYGANEAGWKETANSDVVVVTSGVPRKPGMSRDDLLNVNYKIMQAVTEQIVKYSPNTIIVPVANPLDAMCQAVYRLSKFPRERVIGMAGVLDSARMRTFIAMEMVEIILKDKKKIVPCSVFLQGEYGIRDLFVGVPVKLGARGVEQIIQIKLSAEEDAALKKSAAAVKELVDVIGM